MSHLRSLPMHRATRRRVSWLLVLAAGMWFAGAIIAAVASQ